MSPNAMLPKKKKKKKKTRQMQYYTSDVEHMHICVVHVHMIYSVKFRSLVSSSSNSWRSPSEILSARLGISDLASSALSQHRLPRKDACRQYDVILSSCRGRSPNRQSQIYQKGKQANLPSCERSNISSSVCEFSSRSTALIFSSSLNRANTSR